MKASRLSGANIGCQTDHHLASKQGVGKKSGQLGTPRILLLGESPPMRANFGARRTWHFAFKSGHAPTGSEGGGEGVTHEFAKAAICELERIQFKLKNDDTRHIRFSRVEEEWRFEDEGREYAIDLVGTVCYPPELVEHWNAKLGIELVISHPVGRTKKRALSALNFPVVQIRISKRLIRSNHDVERMSDGDLRRLKQQITGWFASWPIRYYSWLHYGGRSFGEFAESFEPTSYASKIAVIPPASPVPQATPIPVRPKQLSPAVPAAQKPVQSEPQVATKVNMPIDRYNEPRQSVAIRQGSFHTTVKPKASWWHRLWKLASKIFQG
jgi:hypothetical protein